MNKLCRQVSIESPGKTMKDCVFSFDIPIPDVPRLGARIKVVCAGACYRIRRSPSISSMSSASSSSFNCGSSEQAGAGASSSETATATASSPAHHGVRDSALFPGYEVAGIIDELGVELAAPNCGGMHVGQRVILYPYDGIPHGYAEYIVVPELKYLVPIPDTLALSVAAMLPTGALLAKSAVFTAHEYVEKLLAQNPDKDMCKILIVGTGGLALWAMRIAAHHFSNAECREKVQITVASLRDEGFLLAQEFQKVNVVQWSEALYEKQLIERTIDACNGLVDIVIDFGTTSRSLHRSLQCLNKGGVVLISEEVGERLLPKFSKRAEQLNQSIRAVANGSIEMLSTLVKDVASGVIEPPPHTVFPAEEALEVIRKLCQSEIPGRAILRFHDIE